jgi:hypothetical protein
VQRDGRDNNADLAKLSNLFCFTEMIDRILSADDLPDQRRPYFPKPKIGYTGCCMDHPLSAAFDRAIDRLFERRTLSLADRAVVVACLIRPSDWRPLDAPWWKKKQASIIGADLSGNFFLRASDGTVRYWSHQSQSETMVARSVRKFLDMLMEPSS